MSKLERDFYDRDSLEVARDLLGKNLVHVNRKQNLIGKIVEVEAYIGDIDKACHAYKNKMTNRTKALYGPPGSSYVYLIYGMYYCFNVVTEREGKAAAILIRALQPLDGLDLMAQKRYQKSLDILTRREIINLTNGPGKLSMAMGINKSHNQMDLCGHELYITDGLDADKSSIVSGPRINIDYAEEAVDFPWRYYIKGNSYLSKK